MWPRGVGLSVRVRECEVCAVEGDEKVGCVPHLGEGVDDSGLAGSWEYVLALKIDKAGGGVGSTRARKIRNEKRTFELPKRTSHVLPHSRGTFHLCVHISDSSPHAQRRCLVSELT